jgi:hypothetical protein
MLNVNNSKESPNDVENKSELEVLMLELLLLLPNNEYGNDDDEKFFFLASISTVRSMFELDALGEDVVDDDGSS